MLTPLLLTTRMALAECTPTKIWMLVRHGTRNPSVKLIRQMRDRLPQIRNLILNTASDLPEDLIKALRKWEIHITDNEQKQLTHEGEEEMLRLAERMQRRFPDVLSPVYSNSSYKVYVRAKYKWYKCDKFCVIFSLSSLRRKELKKVPNILRQDFLVLKTQIQFIFRRL